MYIPAPNRESDPAELRRFLRAHPLCALVTMTPGGLLASHLPTVLHDDPDGGFGTLRTHVARGNDQWRAPDPATEALAIFTGPEHYISASWYPGKAVHGREVPTWNYIAVHAYGPLRVVDDPAWLLDHVTALTEQQEAGSANPWHVADAPPEFIDKMCRAIVGLELPITRIEGRWKASQNRTEADAEAVTAALRDLDTPASLTMSDLIRTRRPA